jgi:hypothetical protein
VDVGDFLIAIGLLFGRKPAAVGRDEGAGAFAAMAAISRSQKALFLRRVAPRSFDPCRSNHFGVEETATGLPEVGPLGRGSEGDGDTARLGHEGNRKDRKMRRQKEDQEARQ